MNKILIECHACSIGKHELEFIINTVGLTLYSDDNFTLQMDRLYTDRKENDCVTLEDYIRSYYHLMIFRLGNILTHESISPSSDDFTPCTVLSADRGDVLVTVPNVLYAGMSYKLTIGITRPSKMVRVKLNSSSSDLDFSPSVVYINSYDLTSQEINIYVSSSALPCFAYINISH